MVKNKDNALRLKLHRGAKVEVFCSYSNEQPAAVGYVFDWLKFEGSLPADASCEACIHAQMVIFLWRYVGSLLLPPLPSQM